MPSLPLPYTLANGTLADATQVMADLNTLLNAINDGHITTVGTIVSGTWQGAKVNLTYGGTNADLSATGGTHQVLQQASVGAAVTVGQLAASDISGLATSATTDTTNAANISSGTLAAARGGAGTVNGALKANGSGAVSQAAMADVSDYTAPTAWTPIDGSGAGLTFTVTDARYVKVGKVAIVSGAITWPVTGNGSAAKVAGLPLTSFAGSDDVGGGATSLTTGISIAQPAFLSVQRNATTFTMTGVGSGSLTNANMSGATIRFTIMYITA